MNSGVIEHDRKIFIQADEILPEKHILLLINELHNSHSYFRESINAPYKFLDFFRETSNQFTDKQLKLKLDDFSIKLDALLSFMGENFWDSSDSFLNKCISCENNSIIQGIFMEKSIEI